MNERVYRHGKMLAYGTTNLIIEATELENWPKPEIENLTLIINKIEPNIFEIIV